MEKKCYCSTCRFCGHILDFDRDWNDRMCNKFETAVRINEPRNCGGYEERPSRPRPVEDEQPPIPPMPMFVTDPDVPAFISCVDWEQRRFELVKVIAGAYYSNPAANHHGAVNHICRVADEIIDKLKADYEKSSGNQTT